MESDRNARQNEQQKATPQEPDARREQISDLPQQPVDKDEQVKGGRLQQRNYDV